MFWSDVIAEKIKKRKLPLEWVDDMKTASGRIHVGSLRGVVVHDLIYKSLLELGVNAKYTYIFDNHDPMDALPVYLPKETFEQYLGIPLFRVPSPEKGYGNYAEFYAKEFSHVFNTIGCKPEIIWASKLYESGKMNEVIRESLDEADVIRKIYEKIYDKVIAKPWYPFQPYCLRCGKVSTTTVTDWNGKEVTYTCEVNKVKFTHGCGLTEKISPFSNDGKMVGKLPWKVEWSAKWKVLGVTVEGAGKDHMTKGGSHDVTSLISKQVFRYTVPYAFGYEWFILGKAKMSTSKGVGSSAVDMLDVLPPTVLRFLMVRTKINSEINFNLSNQHTIPALFDEYQKAAYAYFENGDKDLARIFQLSQLQEPKRPPKIRFSILAQWVQMPNMQNEIKKEGLEEWAMYARNWIEKYAPESEKFIIQKTLPEQTKNLSEKQKQFLVKIASEVDKKWDAEKFQFEIYEWGKLLDLGGKESFAAIYTALLGKDHGPKAGWLILSLDKEFIKKRFQEIAKLEMSNQTAVRKIIYFHKPDIFSIDGHVKEMFPSISVGVAIIKNVNIEKRNEKLENEKEKLLKSLIGLTTDQLGQYPEIVSYRDLYKKMGIDWHSRRPSPEALLRRIALKKGLYTINTCVDAYNLVVMKNRVSVGAFDLDMLSMPTIMRFAKSGEEILLLGDNDSTKYTEKELAYFDQKGGFNIDFNFRDSQRTAVQMDTKNLYINVDGVYNVTPEKVEQVLRETCDYIIKYCGGQLESFGVDIA